MSDFCKCKVDTFVLRIDSSAGGLFKAADIEV